MSDDTLHQPPEPLPEAEREGNQSFPLDALLIRQTFTTKRILGITAFIFALTAAIAGVGFEVHYISTIEEALRRYSQKTGVSFELQMEGRGIVSLFLRTGVVPLSCFFASHRFLTASLRLMEIKFNSEESQRSTIDESSKILKSLSDVTQKFIETIKQIRQD